MVRLFFCTLPVISHASLRCGILSLEVTLLTYMFPVSLSEIPNTTLRIMPLGGSITYGVGSSTGNGYREPLFDILVAQGYSLDLVGSRRSGSMNNNHHEGWRG